MEPTSPRTAETPADCISDDELVYVQRAMLSIQEAERALADRQKALQFFTDHLAEKYRLTQQDSVALLSGHIARGAAQPAQPGAGAQPTIAPAEGA